MLFFHFFILINIQNLFLINAFISPLNIINMIDTKTIAGFITVLDSVNTHPSKIPFFKGVNIIGRSSGKATVVINQASISQKHAKLIVTDNKMVIVDLDSKNGIRINSQINLIEKNKQFTIEQSMIIYLAEAKCKFQLIKQAPKNQVQKNKIKPQTLKFKSNNDFFSFDQDDYQPPQIKKQIKPKVTENVNLPKKDVKPDQQKGKSVKTSQATKESDNAIDFTIQKINGQKIIQKAQNSIQQKNSKGANKQIKAKSLKIITEIVQNKEACDIEESKDKQKTAKEKETKSKKGQKKDKKAEKQETKQEEKVNSKQKEKKKKDNKKEQKKAQNIIEQNNLPKKSNPKIQQKKKESPKKIKEDKVNGQKNNLKYNKSSKQQKQESVQTKIQKSRFSKDKNKDKNKDKKNKQTSFASKTVKSSNENDEVQRYKTLKLAKRRPSESLERQAGIIPRRSQKANKRILTSGYQLNLVKKYFLVVQSIDDDYDYLIMKNYIRTFKALFSICKGIMIIKHQWIKDSQFFEKIMDANNYLFEEIDYIYDAIKKVKEGEKIFRDYQFYLISKEYHIKQKQIEILIQACGGSVLIKVPQKMNKDKIAIIRNFSKLQDIKDEIKQAKGLGFTKIYSLQMILDSCQKQHINWKNNDLLSQMK